jgi:hypothetical protein
MLRGRRGRCLGCVPGRLILDIPFLFETKTLSRFVRIAKTMNAAEYTLNPGSHTTIERLFAAELGDDLLYRMIGAGILTTSGDQRVRIRNASSHEDLPCLEKVILVESTADQDVGGLFFSVGR